MYHFLCYTNCAMNNCLNIKNIDCFIYSLNEIIFEKCFVDIIHSVVVADIALRWYTKIIIFKKRPFTCLLYTSLVSGNQAKELKNWTVYNFPVDYSFIKDKKYNDTKILPAVAVVLPLAVVAVVRVLLLSLIHIFLYCFFRWSSP